MIVKKSNEIKTTKAPKEYFDGNVWADFLIKDEGIPCNAAIVSFEPNAKNNWHYHTVGQILIVTKGTGFVQKKGEHKQTITVGDIVIVFPNEIHWHGATPDSLFSHIAIQLIDQKDEETVWLDAVTDEEYNSQYETKN